MERPMRAVLIAAYALTLVSLTGGCSAESTTSAESVPTTQTTATGSSAVSTIRNLPELVDPDQFADMQGPTDLPELVGLTKHQAEEWARQSGFRFFATSEDDIVDILLSTRVVVTLNSDDVVTAAVVG